MTSSNPLKNKQLFAFMLAANIMGVLLSLGWAMQHERLWYLGIVIFFGASLFLWFMTWLLRNNP